MLAGVIDPPNVQNLQMQLKKRIELKWDSLDMTLHEVPNFCNEAGAWVLQGD